MGQTLRVTSEACEAAEGRESSDPILTEDEQHRLLAACPRKLRAIVTLALITGARIGELLALRWEHCQDGFMIFLETKNGKARRIPISPAIAAVLANQPRIHPWVFTNVRTRRPLPIRPHRCSDEPSNARAF